MINQPKTFNKVLIAEDDHDDYLFFAEALDRVQPDLSLYRAKNGVECIQMLKQFEYDIIFLDLNMPLKTGLDCLKYLESIDSAVPTIIYSTSHYLKDIDMAFKMGACFYIIKPTDQNHLTELLLNVFTRLTNYTSPTPKEEFVLGLKSNTVLS